MYWRQTVGVDNWLIEERCWLEISRSAKPESNLEKTWIMSGSEREEEKEVKIKSSGSSKS
jgi:hypothetical protein